MVPAQVFMQLAGLVEVDKEVAKLEKKLANLTVQLEAVAKRLADPAYIAKVRPASPELTAVLSPDTSDVGVVWCCCCLRSRRRCAWATSRRRRDSRARGPTCWLPSRASKLSRETTGSCSTGGEAV